VRSRERVGGAQGVFGEAEDTVPLRPA